MKTRELSVIYFWNCVHSISILSTGGWKFCLFSFRNNPNDIFVCLVIIFVKIHKFCCEHNILHMFTLRDAIVILYKTITLICIYVGVILFPYFFHFLFNWCSIIYFWRNKLFYYEFNLCIWRTSNFLKNNGLKVLLENKFSLLHKLTVWQNKKEVNTD